MASLGGDGRQRLQLGAAGLERTGERGKEAIEAFLEGAGSEIVAVAAIPRAQLKPAVGVDVKRARAALAGRVRARSLLAGLGPEVGILSLDVTKLLVGERDATRRVAARRSAGT